MKEELIRKFVEKLDYSYNYKTTNERENIINDLCEIAGIEQLTIPAVSHLLAFCEWYKTTNFNCEGNPPQECVDEYLKANCG